MPLLKSWVESANSPTTDFPLNNLPYGVFSLPGIAPHCGVAIGDYVLDVVNIDHGLDPQYFNRPTWNDFMAAGPVVWSTFRARLTELLTDKQYEESVRAHLVPRKDVQLLLPLDVTEYTDFYSSKQHATNVGTMFRGKENALTPNWLWMPIGYNGRASSVCVSGTPVQRPWGQLKREGVDPVFSPCERFDIELEVGAIVGQPSSGMVSVEQADDMIFGYVLLNDWSARDIQSWEYQPLGPFQSKATATTISPWIVSKAALEPFRTRSKERDVPLLKHLQETRDMLYDIDLEVVLTPGAGEPTTLARTNYKELYFSAPQQLCHHTSCGCSMRVGDLLGSGTISGPRPDNFGSLLELSWGGKHPIELNGGGTRSFLNDGDTVTLKGSAKGDGFKIGFGDCVGTIVPARAAPV
ncbi:fumarylacetoacetase [Pseudomonas putida]|uniref:fumarylacetoacetase n=1 Tax=Pseudomonas putida TaxID=303 RepID=UPI002363C971|nr:fumarylacetoacetase [Pseudomonas putida]MDD1963822.1 fumarylacetoacetase [Pseudomonas putida]